MITAQMALNVLLEAQFCSLMIRRRCRGLVFVALDALRVGFLVGIVKIHVDPCLTRITHQPMMRPLEHWPGYLPYAPHS